MYTMNKNQASVQISNNSLWDDSAAKIDFLWEKTLALTRLAQS